MEPVRPTLPTNPTYLSFTFTDSHDRTDHVNPRHLSYYNRFVSLRLPPPSLSIVTSLPSPFGKPPRPVFSPDRFTRETSVGGRRRHTCYGFLSIGTSPGTTEKGPDGPDLGSFVTVPYSRSSPFRPRPRTAPTVFTPRFCDLQSPPRNEVLGRLPYFGPRRPPGSPRRYGQKDRIGDGPLGVWMGMTPSLFLRPPQSSWEGTTPVPLSLGLVYVLVEVEAVTGVDVHSTQAHSRESGHSCPSRVLSQGSSVPGLRPFVSLYLSVLSVPGPIRGRRTGSHSRTTEPNG